MKKKGNMYQTAIKTWNPFKGCRFNCKYCLTSFQLQAKRQKQDCKKCYNYEPHVHLDRLDDTLPNTGYMQFIFACSSGDISFCKTEDFELILDRIRNEPNKTFLLQSKNPATFKRVNLPKNLIIGTTIETNRDALCNAICKAPPPSKRYKDLLAIKHHAKMMTLEPIMEFDHKTLVKWVKKINPVMVWLGYNSYRFDNGKHVLPEPELEKVKELYFALGEFGYTVMLKTIRERR